MSEFKQFNLSSILEQLGEERTKKILSSFVCPLNEDVQDFCRTKAIEFSKRGFAQTYLIYWQEGAEKEFIGYYTIAMKHFSVNKKQLSNKLFSRVRQHGHMTFQQESILYQRHLLLSSERILIREMIL